MSTVPRVLVLVRSRSTMYSTSSTWYLSSLKRLKMRVRYIFCFHHYELNVVILIHSHIYTKTNLWFLYLFSFFFSSFLSFFAMNKQQQPPMVFHDLQQQQTVAGNSSSSKFVVVMVTTLLAFLCQDATSFSLGVQKQQPSLLSPTILRKQQQQNGYGFGGLFMSTTEETQATSTTTTSTTKKRPGTAVMDTPWAELGFEFRPTNSHVKLVYTQNPDGQGGQWSTPSLVSEPYIQLHIGATALHYGQACFEGLKAFCHEDESVYLFRPDMNAQRMQQSCQRLVMPELPTDVFIDAVKLVVQDNIEYVPPYGSNGALYIRPLLFGSGPRIGLQPATEYTFLIMVIPVGDYYKGGLAQPVQGKVMTEYDRAAPRGVGNVKVAGNYAADLLPNMLSKKEGFPIILYLDAVTQTQIEEFSTSNFVGINHATNTYVTPATASVLPSVTNKSLMQIAADLEGMKIEARNVPFEEMQSFDEVLAVGTAVVVTPVGSIQYDGSSSSDTKNEQQQQKIIFGNGKDIGPTTKKLYQHIRDIQNGHREDKYNWLVKV